MKLNLHCCLITTALRDFKWPFSLTAMLWLARGGGMASAPKSGEALVPVGGPKRTLKAALVVDAAAGT